MWLLAQARPTTAAVQRRIHGVVPRTCVSCSLCHLIAPVARRSSPLWSNWHRPAYPPPHGRRPQQPAAHDASSLTDACIWPAAIGALHCQPHTSYQPVVGSGALLMHAFGLPPSARSTASPIHRTQPVVGSGPRRNCAWCCNCRIKWCLGLGMAFTSVSIPHCLRVWELTLACKGHLAICL